MKMRKLAPLILSLLVAAMALPQAASAISPRPFAVAENFRGDLVMVNNGVAWQDVTCLRGCTPFAVATTETARFVLKRPHGRPTELARTKLVNIPGGSNSILTTVRFAASPSSTVMVRSREENIGDQLSSSATIFSGTLGSKPSQLISCEAAFELPFALDDGHLAYDDSRCTTGSSDVVVRSLADGTVRRVSLPGRLVDTLGLAGDRLAVLSYPRSPTPDSGEIAVFDLTTGAQVSSAATGGLGLTPTVLDIRSDGTVAYVTYPLTAKAASCRGTLFVLGPGTAPRTLASGVCQLAKLAADEVVAKRKTKLVAIPLSGSEHTLVNLGQVAVVAADAQNTKVGYAMPTCAGDTAIRFTDLATDPDDAGLAPCPLRIASGSSQVAPNGSFRVRLRCRRGCGGFVSLRRHGATRVEAVRARRRVLLGEAAADEVADGRAAPARKPERAHHHLHGRPQRAHRAPCAPVHPRTLTRSPRRARGWGHSGLRPGLNALAPIACESRRANIERVASASWRSCSS